MATRLSRTPSSTGNRKTWTFSAWIKRTGSISGTNTQNILYAGTYSIIRFENENLEYLDYDGSTTALKNTSAKLRDTNAWYHIVVSADFTQASADDRVKFYINGEQQTSFGTNNVKAQNYDTRFNLSGTSMNLGADASNGSPFNGLMSHIHFIDGTAYDADDFGETDANGVWKINTSPSVTYGTNGFFILKDGNSVTDESGNSNNFTVAGGTLTNTEDNPSNVFATLNPLTPNSYTFSNGNNTIVRGSAISSTMGTIAPSSGKWYWEVKLVSGQSNYPRIGIYKASNADNHIHTTYIGNVSGGTGKWWGSGTSQTGIIANGTDSSTAFYSYSNGDILMFAMDNDNGKLWFGKNGTWYTNNNSSTTTGTAIGNNTATPAFSNVTVGENWSPSVFGNVSADVWSCNFGNGYFGTTAVSSAGTNASGNGIFEYDVPTGFTALSTKGLNL